MTCVPPELAARIRAEFAHERSIVAQDVLRALESELRGERVSALGLALGRASAEWIRPERALKLLRAGDGEAVAAAAKTALRRKELLKEYHKVLNAWQGADR